MYMWDIFKDPCGCSYDTC